MNRMNILLLEPGKRPRSAVITGTLQSMQQVVDGPIQAVYPFAEPVALICNEEGKLRNLPWNRALRDEAGQIYDIVAGTCFLCAAPPGEDSFAGLTDAQLDAFSRRFAGTGVVHSHAGRPGGPAGGGTMSAWETIFSSWMPDPGRDRPTGPPWNPWSGRRQISSAAGVHPSRWMNCPTPTPAGKQPRCASPSAEAFCWASG